MENFTRVDLYDTKGTEYLFVIAYLIILIFFWNFAMHPRKTISKIKSVLNTITSGILRIPQGIFFSKYHTWTHLEKSGDAKVGLDDFLQHTVGEVKFTNLKKQGDTIAKGDLMTELNQNGKHLSILSPISGEVLDINSDLIENPDLISKDPYDQGWVYRIKPSKWVKDTSSHYLAEEAKEWSDNELTRFKDFLASGPMKELSSEPSMVLLQDGGEIKNNILSELPEDVWVNFQEEFLK